MTPKKMHKFKVIETIPVGKLWIWSASSQLIDNQTFSFIGEFRSEYAAYLFLIALRTDLTEAYP